jgi:hypothetical protein
MIKVEFKTNPHRRSMRRSVLVWLLLQVVLLAALITNPARATAPGAPSSASATLGVRQFYLTTSLFQASDAPSACTTGYHFASIWEIADPSSLEYNTALGQSSPDSGTGPPTAFGRTIITPARGWVRTGYDDSIVGTPGQGNCDAWSSNSNTSWGSVANLPSDWTGGAQDVGVWDTTVWLCSTEHRVWCVQDDSVLRVFLSLILKN